MLGGGEVNEEEWKCNGSSILEFELNTQKF